MISARMSRVAKVLLSVCAVTAAAATVAACGTQKITVPTQDADLHQGAVLFAQRCSGCHTLSFAAAQGSAAKVTTKELNNGPSFNVRCERPLTRVLYAIENGGFSGAIMPQNIVLGQDAVKVAKFVATYSGRQSPVVPGVASCSQLPVGNLPALGPGGTASGSTTAQSTTSGAAKPASAGRKGKTSKVP
jgi:mono/diheme cytochrome c family protein